MKTNWKQYQERVRAVIYDLVSALPRVDNENRGPGQTKSGLITEAIKKIDVSKFENEEIAKKVIWHFWEELEKAGIICCENRQWFLTLSGSVACNRYNSFLLNVIEDEREATIHKNLIERLGVSAIETFFCRIGWIFRERAHTDYGIDADVEMPEQGRLSSRHIALQIKSGESFFSSPGIVTYNMDWSHFSYWLLSDRPVVFMVYDPRDGAIFWEQVRPRVDMYKANKFPLRLTHKLEDSNKTDFEKIAVSYLPIIQTTNTGKYSDDFALFAINSYLDSCESLLNQYSPICASLMQNSLPENCLYLDLLRVELSIRLRVDAIYLSSFFLHIDSDSSINWSEKVSSFVEYQRKWDSFLDNMKTTIIEYQSEFASQSNRLAFISSMCLDVFTEYLGMEKRFLKTGNEYLQSL